MSSLLNNTLPPLGLRFPAIKLNNVVFPEPFGPIIPVIEPLIFKEQSLTAARPPKYFERLSVAEYSDLAALIIILYLIFLNIINRFF